MAIQTSDITLSGKHGDQVHFRRNGKNFTRKASKKYQMSENSIKTYTEFGSASSAGALIRKGFASFINTVNPHRDEGLVNRFNGKLVGVIGTGPEALKGKRKVTDGDIDLLSGMELSPIKGLAAVFPVDPEVTVHEFDGVCITLPPFKTEEIFRHKYITSTDAVIKIISCTFDFAAKNGKMSVAEDLVLPVVGVEFPGGTLEFPLDTAGERVLIIGVMVYFRSKDSAIITNRRYMAAQLVKAALVRDGKIIPFIYPEKTTSVPEAASSTTKIAWKLKPSASIGKGLENAQPEA